MEIISAKELLQNRVYITQDDVEDVHSSVGSVTDVMIEFAQLHVQAALKVASENATVTPIDHEEISEGSFRPIWGVDDDSILNSYPLSNIK
jgi:hypothetical protein